MRKRLRYLVGLVAVAGFFVLATHAGAETYKLELKKADLSIRGGVSDDAVADNMRATYSQSFSQDLKGHEIVMIIPSPDKTQPKFSKVITKEPAKYVAEMPFRGVAVLGSRHYGFVFDVAAAKKEGKKKAVNYTRLYFDRNHNGDLTDDGVIEATSSEVDKWTGIESTFPTIELTSEVDGKKLDCVFTFRVTMSGGDYPCADAWLNSVVYREGQITLDGKRRRMVLIDYNNNGRFDDVGTIHERRGRSAETVHPVAGDMLVLDPSWSVLYDPYSLASGDYAHPVGKLIRLGGRLFELQVDPSGETLSLEPASVPVGYVTNSNKGFRAFVYGDQGIVKVAPDESGKAPLPAGEWKLLSYMIDRTETPKPYSEPAKQEAKKEAKKSFMDMLGGILTPATPSTTQPRPEPLTTLVLAAGTRDSEPIKVVKGETVEIPFGPPYTPRVSVLPVMLGRRSSVSLGFHLMGRGGEVCRKILVNGHQPSAPEFTIFTKDGKEVLADKFRNDYSFTYRYSWRVPSDPADEYQIKVRMDTGPFKIDEEHRSIIRRADLMKRRFHPGRPPIPNQFPPIPITQ